MKTIWNLDAPKVLVGILLALYVMQIVSAKCKTEEVEICSILKGCFCRTCISCPAGFGPTHQCGGKYVNGTVISCKPCINGVSYSEEYSISSCRPCHQCGGRETLQKCTPKSETSCSTKCKRGYIMNHAVEDCVPDPSFMTTSPSNNTAKLTHAYSPKTTPTIGLGSTATPEKGNKTQGKTNETPSPNLPDTSGSTSSSQNSNHARDNKIIILSVFGVAIAACILYCCYKKRKQLAACFCCNHDRNQDEEAVRLTIKIDPRPLLESVQWPWPDHFRLKDIKPELCSDVASFISKTSTVLKDWRAIGGKLGLDSIALRAIDVEGSKPGTSQGEQLFIKLRSCQPELQLTTFVNTLGYLGRKDVVEIIVKDFQPNSNSAVQIEEPEVIIA